MKSSVLQTGTDVSKKLNAYVLRGAIFDYPESGRGKLLPNLTILTPISNLNPT
jgi:hypothetical protein